MKEVEEVVQVLTLGARKYEDWNWQKVIRSEKGTSRYFSAALRHLAAYQSKNDCDTETGLSHLAHAVCCILFLMWNDNFEKRRKR